MCRLARWSMVVGVLALMASSGGAVAHGAVLSPGRILYSDAGGPGVRSVAPDGSAAAVVAMDPAGGSVDTFSRSVDGRFVAIADQSRQVWIVPTDGSSGAVIVGAGSPAFAPDASDRLAYLDPSGRLVIANPDGTTLVASRGSRIASPAAWSPDATEVIVDGLQRFGATPQLASLRGDVYPGSTPAWSPHGHRIAFVTVSGRLEVGRDRGGCCATAITGRLSVAAIVPLAWSPDGRRIAFMKQLPFAQADVMVATLPAHGHGVRVRRIDRGDSFGGLSFSPDGQSLAYDRGSSGQNNENIFATPIAKPAPTLVARDGVNPLWIAG
jgi:Tol biopolymer transport system component